jgi:hypothetical protein
MTTTPHAAASELWNCELRFVILSFISVLSLVEYGVPCQEKLIVTVTWMSWPAVTASGADRVVPVKAPWPTLVEPPSLPAVIQAAGLAGEGPAGGALLLVLE